LFILRAYLAVGVCLLFEKGLSGDEYILWISSFGALRGIQGFLKILFIHAFNP
jgi:hypothetical protein